MNEQEIQELVEEIAANNGAQDALDDAVHDIFSGMASDINNCGMLDQIEFLVGQGYTKEQILKM